MSSLLGIDLGGTKIAAARYNAETFELQDSLKRDTEALEGIDHVIKNIINIIKQLQQADTVAVGIGVPGLVLQPAGIVLRMPNIPGATNIALAQKLSEVISLPFSVENDANCFALAEAITGAGKGHTVVAAITFGTGVGGGIVLDGKIFQGANGYAAEFGHLLLQPGQVPYETSDLRGDVEQYLSGTAMGKRCQAATSPVDYLEGEVCEFMRPAVSTEVAWLCTNLIHTLNPSVIIFGGSAGRAFAPHLQSIAKEIQKWVLPGTPLPAIKIAELDDSSTRGAALVCAK